MDLLKSYFESNKKSLLFYIGLCLFFYIVNFTFYRNHMDAPVDLIFTIFFISVIPGIVVFFTLFKSYIINTNNRISLIFIYVFVPFLISFVFVMTYWVIGMRNAASLFEIVSVNGVSFPLMFLSVITVLLFKYYEISITKLLLAGVVVFLVYFISLYGLDAVSSIREDSLISNIGYAILFLVIPFAYMTYLISKLDTISD